MVLFGRSEGGASGGDIVIVVVVRGGAVVIIVIAGLNCQAGYATDSCEK